MRKERILSTAAVGLTAIAATLLLITILASAGPTANTLAPGEQKGTVYALAPVDRVSDPDDSLPALLRTQWTKWVDDVRWTPNLVVTVETSDTIKVTDVITTLPNDSLVLVERWNPAHLALIDHEVEPAGSSISTDDGELVWEVPEGWTQAFALTKWFHVEPSTWTATIMSEALSTGAGQPIEERSVGIEKAPPDLWIDSRHNPGVHPGDVATFTLSYGNSGGYENAVSIRNVFPPTAPFAWSAPPPDEVAPDRLWARWWVGDLARDDASDITVAVAITESVQAPETIEIWDRIYNHVNEERAAVATTFEVGTLPPVGWGKWVNGAEWHPELVLTAQTSDTIEVVDVVESPGLFSLGEFWNPEQLALLGYEATAGDVSASDGNLEWVMPTTPQGAVTLTKRFHVEPGPWDLTVLEEYLAVQGAPDPLVRLLPIEHPFPPIGFPGGDWPSYAQDEIAVHPEPPLAGQTTELCAEVVNHDPTHAHVVDVEFAVANFGIGLPFTPVGHAEVLVPPGGHAMGCTLWVPPTPEHWCIEVRLMKDGAPYVISQRNVDVDEPLAASTSHSLYFPVGNPLGHPVTITLGLVPHLPQWGLELSQDVLPNMQPGDVREVMLTVTPPTELPPDGQPIVDVEAFVEGELIGGFRKIFRPPVILHPFPDPPYAEREITVHPYPALAGRPTEVCVELRNPTPYPQDVVVQFSWANFGIGVPFTPINGPRMVHLPPHSIVKECIHWIPPVSGHVCLQVELFMEGYEPQRSQLNIDVNEPLRPRVPHSLYFPVGNPLEEPVTITLGLIPHLPDWGLELSLDVLPDVQPGEVREVMLTVTPPEKLPPDGQPIVDVEAFAGDRLIGGFRKIFRVPVPIHQPRDPVYAESEIFVDPYPVMAGVPTQLGVEVFNPTDRDQVVTATFSIAPFGIGLPFSTSHILPNPIVIFVPRHGAARGHVVWQSPVSSGKSCVRVTLEMKGHEPVWSQRNIDVGEPLAASTPHSLYFPVGNPFDHPVTITLGLVPHLPQWGLELSQDVLPNMQPGEVREVKLTVTPPAEGLLGSGEPIVDVEAFVEGELIGGFRKLDVPPVPIHKPHERFYAESEISIDPYPPQLGQPSRVSTVVQNSSEETVTVELQFGWAKFGMGIPFSTTGMVPYTRSLTLSPEMTAAAEVKWRPVYSGHQCVRVLLSDAGGIYGSQESQRNVDVVEQAPCGVTKVFTFTVYNDSPISAVVDIGLISFNVPADWEVTVVPSDTLELGPFSAGVVTVTVKIPCPQTPGARQARREIVRLQKAAGAVPTVDAEGYIEGDLVGGIELQFPGFGEGMLIYLPIITK
jgi:hypothetical protein